MSNDAIRHATSLAASRFFVIALAAVLAMRCDPPQGMREKIEALLGRGKAE